jgi:dolichyl-phosphate-mannose--protein O-mannosyl transferase
MRQITDFFKTYSKKWQFWLVIILILCAFTRFYRLGDIKEYVFDEVYHAFTAKMYALDRYEGWVWWTAPPEGVAYEWTHPPLAKVIMSWGIQLFGGPGELPNKEFDPSTLLTPSSFGWRFFSALFGVIATFALFLFSKSIFRNAWVGVLTAFLFTFDLLPLVQSRTAMNDIFAVTFMLFTYYFFTQRKVEEDGIKYPSHLLNYKLETKYWLLTGLFLGLAIASKWTALFTIGLLGLYQLITVAYLFVRNRTEFIPKYWIDLFRQIGLGVSCIIVIPFIVYLLSYSQLFTVNIEDYQGNGLDDSLANMQNRKEYLEGVKQSQASQNELTDEQVKSLKSDIKELEFISSEIAFFQAIKPLNYYYSERFFIWWGLQKQMWWYHTNLKATHGYTSQWWTWPLNIRPVWFYVDYCGVDDTADTNCANSLKNGVEKTAGDIYTMGNPFIFWLILPLSGMIGYVLAGKYRVWLYAVLPASIILLLQFNFTYERSAEPKSLYETAGIVSQAFLPQLLLFSFLLIIFVIFLRLADRASGFIKNKNEDSVKDLDQISVPLQSAIPLFLTLLIFAGYWLPWARSPRIMFFYHFFPPMTFFYPILGYILYRLFKRSKYNKASKFMFWGYLFIVLMSFVYFYPHVTGVLLPDQIRDQYFWLPSWR